MTGNYLLLCLFGISACFLAGAVAHEAILGGQRVDHANQFPYMVSVQIHGYHECNGGIIDDRFVLTAAHCVVNHHREARSKRITVLAGTTNLERTGSPAVTVRVERIYVPKEHRAGTSFDYNDIAVLKLKESLQVDQRPNLKSLAISTDIEVSGSASIAGFGWNAINTVNRTQLGYADDHLYSAETNIVAVAHCENSHRVNLGNRYLCAKLRSRSSRVAGACTGDSGTPLVQHGAVVGILIRISPDCDERVRPAVYARVATIHGRITNIMHISMDPKMLALRL